MTIPLQAPEQGSPEWFAARSGKITASTFIDAIAIAKSGKNKGGSTGAREKLMLIKAFERTSGIPKGEISSQSLAWGKDLEPFASEAYELQTGHFVMPASLITHPDYSYIAGSPDGLVNDDGLTEIKCPKDEAVHMGTWLHGMPEDHVPQVQGNMLCTGRQWADFISYDPRAGERFQLYIQRIPRDNDYIDGILLPGLIQFEMELRAMVQELERKAA